MTFNILISFFTQCHLSSIFCLALTEYWLPVLPFPIQSLMLYYMLCQSNLINIYYMRALLSPTYFSKAMFVKSLVRKNENILLSIHGLILNTNSFLWHFYFLPRIYISNSFLQPYITNYGNRNSKYDRRPEGRVHFSSQR